MGEKESRTYPYKAWVVSAAGVVKEVEVTRLYYRDPYNDRSWHMTNTRKAYAAGELHPTRDAAIAAGLAACDAKQAKLTKQQERLDKLRAAITKATTP